MKVAIVCDWLVGIGGAERVTLELHKMFPDAPIFTSQYDPTAINWFLGADVRTTWLQKMPKKLRKFYPVFRAWSFSRLDLSDYDLVLSSSGAEAKAVKIGPNTIHIAYTHAPTHYYWSRYEAYLSNPGFGLLDPIAKLGLIILVGPMRRWDKKAAKKPTYLVANSKFTKAQIKKYYGRDSTVIHPPVDVNRFKTRESALKKRMGFLIAGRQTPYKRFDLVIGATSKEIVPLTVIGNGPQHTALIKMAGPSATFLTNLADNEVPVHFQEAEAFIFPGIDDFGIVAVEALAAGTPVIAYHEGGALDYIKPGVTGVFFDKPTVDSLVDAIKKFQNTDFDHKVIAKSAEEFSVSEFHKRFDSFVDTHLPKPLS
jgi:glycosyltransferase involved in cell wall biosynthesis